MEPEHSCEAGIESTQRPCRRSQMLHSFFHVHYGLSLPLREGTMRPAAPVKQNEQQGQKKPAALWATALASNSHLGGTDNSH